MPLKLFDCFIILFFIAAQWRMTTLALRAANRRLSGRALRVAKAAVIVWTVCVPIGYLLSFSELVSYLGISPRWSLYAGALVLSYLIVATVVLSITTLLRLLRPRLLPEHADPMRRRLVNAAGTVLMASPVVALGYGTFIARTNFRIREIDLPITDLPPALDGLRLLHLSDIHLSAFLTEQEFAGVIDSSNELRPHVAVVTGDLISSTGDPLDACLSQVARLRSDAGVFGCMGNHERYAGAENHAEAAGARLGVRFLRHQNEVLTFNGAKLNVAGVDYQRIGDRRTYLPKAGKLIVPGAVNLLLSHNPDVLPVAAARGFDAVLAGHTHGGQVTIEILDQQINPARFFTPYVYGLYREGKAAAYVTRGIGTIGLPTRIGAPPEISLLRLRKA